MLNIVISLSHEIKIKFLVIPDTDKIIPKLYTVNKSMVRTLSLIHDTQHFTLTPSLLIKWVFDALESIS
jgi:hypothetical protein